MVNGCSLSVSVPLNGIRYANEAALVLHFSRKLNQHFILCCCTCTSPSSSRSLLSDPAGCLNAAISQSHLHPEALYQAQLFLFDCLFVIVVVAVVVPDVLLKAVKLHFIKAQ